MPDPRDEYDYLYQVGENSYVDPWNMRTLFGPRENRALTSQEEVNVTAPRPPANAPYPKNMDEIYLGTRTAPPTGTFIDPNAPMPKVVPELQPAWNEFTKQYPFANKMVSGVKVKGSPGNLGRFSNDNIEITPTTLSTFKDMLPSTLAHEATHAAQFQQFPDEPGDNRNDKHYGDFFDPHDKRPGEQIAYATEDAVERRQRPDIHTPEGLKAYNEQAAIARAQEQEDYLTGKLPIMPSWMKQSAEQWERLREHRRKYK